MINVNVYYSTIFPFFLFFFFFFKKKLLINIKKELKILIVLNIKIHRNKSELRRIKACELPIY